MAGDGAAREPAALPPCAFCGGTDGAFLPVGRRNGVPVRVHEECVEWAPECYEAADGKWVGIRKAVKRSGKCRCPVCGKGHAALGCAVAVHESDVASVDYTEDALDCQI